MPVISPLQEEVDGIVTEDVEVDMEPAASEAVDMDNVIAVDVQKGQSSHTVRPSEPAEKAAAQPAEEVKEERAAAPAQAEPERKPHRTKSESAPAPKEHHRKAPIVDDDDDEFEFGFLNWDDDDK